MPKKLPKPYYPEYHKLGADLTKRAHAVERQIVGRLKAMAEDEGIGPILNVTWTDNLIYEVIEDWETYAQVRRLLTKKWIDFLVLESGRWEITAYRGEISHVHMKVGVTDVVGSREKIYKKK